MLQCVHQLIFPERVKPNVATWVTFADACGEHVKRDRLAVEPAVPVVAAMPAERIDNGKMIMAHNARRSQVRPAESGRPAGKVSPK